MVVHTCRSIWFIDWVVWINIQNGLNCFWKWVWKWLWSERKENLKIKEFRKLWNLFLESLPTICSFLLNWKVCLKPHLNLTWVMFETWTDNGKMENCPSLSRGPSLPPLCRPAQLRKAQRSFPYPLGSSRLQSCGPAAGSSPSHSARPPGSADTSGPFV